MGLGVGVGVGVGVRVAWKLSTLEMGRVGEALWRQARSSSRNCALYGVRMATWVGLGLGAGFGLGLGSR